MATTRNPLTDPDLVNDGTVSLKVPGFGHLIDLELNGNNYNDIYDHRFRHGVNDFRADRLTVRELAMLRFMDAITDKPDWNKKVNDEEIVGKWRDEASKMPGGMISEKTFEWCVRELRDRAKDFEKDGIVRTLESASRVCKSDGIISTQLRDELKQTVAPLLGVDEKDKDWHPKSNDQVLNLVHPSLYPLIYGKTRLLPTGQVGLLDCMASTGKGDITKADQKVGEHRPGNQRMNNINSTLWSTRFQWLPAEVKFKGDTGTDVKFASYINNLPPWGHRDLYKVIEKFISKSIPLWNEVLIKDKARASVRIRTYGGQTDPPDLPEWLNDIPYSGEPTEEQVAKVNEYLEQSDNPDFTGDQSYGDIPDDWGNEPGWDPHTVVQEKYWRTRKVVHPEPGVSYSYEQWKAGDTAKGVVPAYESGLGGGMSGEPLDSYTVRLEEQFRAQGLQVIVKLSSIELTPEKPDYPGGNWHLEGMLNEHIVATSIYYYDVSNVTDSHLRFRQEAELDDYSLAYEQGDHDPVCVTFGADSMTDEPAVQEIGNVATRGDRLLAFPNTLQHKVDPFSLVDKTRPGHRRFLVLWLVDPHYRIASTANAPPQQKEWWVNNPLLEESERRLPAELANMVMEAAMEGQISLEEAKAYRLELMKERTVFVDTVERNYDTYNLCEH